MEVVEEWVGKAGRALARFGRVAEEWRRRGVNLGLNMEPRTAAGTVALSSYWCLGVIVAEPTAAGRVLPERDATNALVFASIASTSVWLWKRPHLSGTAPGRRLSWTLLGSSCYVLGSILTWAIIRSAVGRRSYVNVALCSLAGGAFTYSALDYFKYLDRDFEPSEEISDEINISDPDKYDSDI